MACSDYNNLQDIIRDFSGQAPLDAVICPFTSSMGAGIGLTAFSLLIFSFIGLGITIRTQHIGPVMVAGMVSAGVIAAELPAGATQIFALVLFFVIVPLGLYLYQRAQSSL